MEKNKMFMLIHSINRDWSLESEEDFKDKLATMITFIRNELDLTQAELAKRIGVSPSTIGNYEQGTRTPDLQTLAKISNLLTKEDILTMKNEFLQMPAIEEKEDHNNDKIPVYGNVSCGGGSLMMDNVIDYEEKGELEEADFIIQTTGSSMNKLGIFEGSKVLIKKQNYAQNNDIVLASIDNEEALLKRYKTIDEGFVLVPESTEPYERKVFMNEETERVKILGIATAVRLR